jgi:thiamine-phosphate pyrophosphorylase
LCAALRDSAGDSTWIALHDRVHLVPHAHVDAVHLGFRSLPPIEVRAMLAEHISVGYSAHAGDRKQEREGADYLVFGPVLDTPSKRGIQAPVGFEGLRSAVADAALPVYAIGGLKPEQAARVRASGARGIVVMSGVFGAADPASAVRAYLEAWSS